jgi:hypothetical protein
MDVVVGTSARVFQGVNDPRPPHSLTVRAVQSLVVL